MKNGDIYKHYETGTEYFFIGVSIPVSHTSIVGLDFTKPFMKVFHTETKKEVNLIDCNGVLVNDWEAPLVLYRKQSISNLIIWGMPADMFFGHLEKEPGRFVERFTLHRTMNK